MIRSVSHTPTKAWRRAHRRRAHHSFAIVATLLVVVAGLALAGYFAGVGWQLLVMAIVHSFYRIAASYAIALTIGVSVALLVGTGSLSDFFFPIFDVMQNVPSFALLPLFIYFFGGRDLMIILFAVSSMVWPILFAVMTATKSAHQDLNDAATIFGARSFRRTFHYLAPLSFPAIVTGSIVAVAIGWETVIGAEIIAQAGGFGAFISRAGATGLNPSTIAGVIGILLLVFVINRAIWAPLLTESTKHYAE